MISDKDILDEDIISTKLGKINTSLGQNSMFVQNYILRSLETYILGLVAYYKEDSKSNADLYFTKSMKYLQRAMSDINSFKSKMKNGDKE